MGFFDAIPTGKLVKQFLMGAGVRDPKVLSVVDAVTEGGFDAPQIAPFTGEFHVPLGADAMMIRTERPGDELTLILVRRKRAIDSLPAPVHPEQALLSTGSAA